MHADKKEPGMTVPLEALPAPDQYEMQILSANHWTEPRDLNGGVTRTKGAERVCNLIERTISTNWTTQSSQDLRQFISSSHNRTLKRQLN